MCLILGTRDDAMEHRHLWTHGCDASCTCSFTKASKPLFPIQTVGFSSSCIWSLFSLYARIVNVTEEIIMEV